MYGPGADAVAAAVRQSVVQVAEDTKESNLRYEAFEGT